MLQSREKLLPCAPRPLIVDRRWKTAVEMAPNCPRCDSSNTKFCYYNNYSLTQPRYFCKGCRRYWTKGGSLRNVPVGGGCRKNRRGKSLRQLSSSDHHNRCSSVGMGTYGRGSGGGGEQSSTADSVGSFSQSSSDVGGSASGSSTTDASTIDLAVVYAKFLNQGPASTASFVVDPGTTAPELQNEFDGGDGSFELSTSNGHSNDPGHHSPVQFSGDHYVNMECSFDGLPAAHFGHHHPRDYDPQFTNNPPQHDSLLVDDHQIITSLVHPVTSYGGGGGELQSVAVPSSDDTGCFQPVEEDTLWSSCLMEPNFTPNPHGLESMIEHHLALQPNFLNATTNWTASSFDLSTYDAFTRL